MRRNRMVQLATRAGRVVAVLLLAVFLFTVFTDVGEAAPPTVNGLFYGDGDFDNYTLLNTSTYGGNIYHNLTGTTLYVAVVGATGLMDNVFGDAAYMADAGWPSPHAARFIYDFEYASFTLTACGRTWNWRQGYAGQPGVAPGSATNTDPTWVSNTSTLGGGGTPPPGIVSSSSLAWNMNNYAANLTAGGQLFNMDVFGTGPDNWKSAFDAANPSVVPNYANGYSNTYEWEWPVVYEWSVDLSFAGCAGSTVSVNAVETFFTPPKPGPAYKLDPFPPLPPIITTVTDWGDLPAQYPTTGASNGARHQVTVGGAYLGQNRPDVEADGNPSLLATGDDSPSMVLDDEDGVLFLSGFTWSGLGYYTSSIQVTAGTDGCLSAFMDINGDGTLSQVSLDDGTPLSDYCMSAGTYLWTIRVPGVENDLDPQRFARFRFTNSVEQGGASPNGLATTGEIEDYLIASPTAITLRNISTTGSNVGLAAVLVLALVGLGLTSLYVFSRRQRAA